jgi:signal transduction histidine kinase
MCKEVEAGQVYINNEPFSKEGHPFIKNAMFMPLYNTTRTIIGILGLSGASRADSFQKEDYKLFEPYIDIASYILQLVIERNNTSKQKAEVLSNISNALKKPIDGIMYAKRISDTVPLNLKERQLVDIITFYTVKLLDMVNDIQDYTKLYTGSLSLVNKSMSLDSCLNSVLEMSKSKINTDALKINIETDFQNTNIIISDEIRIVQILMSLLDNCIKYTKKGFVTIKAWLSEEPEQPSRARLNFEITDTGIGMTSEQLNNIFNIKPSNDSIGLGLIIVKRLIELFEGQINITSSCLKGTKVSFFLKVKRFVNLESKFIKKYFADSHALVYGDGDNVQIQDTLMDYGIKTILATNAQDALKYTKGKNIGLCFLNDSNKDYKDINEIKPEIIITSDKHLESDNIYIIDTVNKTLFIEALNRAIVDKEPNPGIFECDRKLKVLIA